MKFQFGVPSFITFGEGCTKNLGQTLVGMNAKNVLCVYDMGVKKAGITDSIIADLLASGLNVVEFDGVLPNPPDTLVEEAAQMARGANIDATVAIGGGSAIDCAKAINILLTNPSPINQYDGLGLVKNPTKPLIAIPTTAGTASEVTGFSIVTDTTRLKKMVIGGPFVGAAMAFADPLLTVGMPPAITASTGMDALTHAIEAYYSVIASPLTDVNALKAISLIYGSLEEATNNGSNIQVRTDMLLGSMLAGIAFNSAVLGLVHAIAHPLSVHCGLPHGVANAAPLAYVIEFNAVEAPEKTKDIGLAMGLNLAGLKDAEASKAVVDAVKKLARDLKIPTLKEAGVKKEDFDRVADDALKEISLLFNPRKATKEDILAILELAF
jgi:alcohol dehydrogenase